MEPPAAIIALPDSLTSQLVAEVYDIILDNFAYSKEELATFSLVCKYWLPLCRSYLFAEVTYRADFARFLATSAHATFTIAPHIRKVTLRGHRLDHEMKNNFWPSILRLPRLASLHVENFNWENMQPLVSIPSVQEISTLHRLSVLHFRSIHFKSFSLLVDLLDSMPALQDLSLDNASWDAVDGTPSRDRPTQDISTLTASSLRKLRITFCHSRVVLNWLCFGIISDATISDKNMGLRRAFPLLSVISLPDILPGEADIFGVFLEAVGGALESLEAGILGHDLGGPNHDVLRSLSIIKNSNLKQIIIREIILFTFPQLVGQNATEDSLQSENPAKCAPYTWIARFISTAGSCSLRMVTFHLWLSAEDQLDALPWSSLSNILSDIGVSQIEFHISGVCRDTSLVKTWFIKRLSTIDARKTAIEFHFCL